ncbi:MAG: hypothetical protein ACLRZ7_07665, partial [Lachnospiraceae bacterium]
ESAEEKYLNDLKVIEYDTLYGDQDVFGGTNPYEEVDMKMGVEDITMSDVLYKDNCFYIMGDGFTTFSKIINNDKILDTTFISENLIVAQDVTPAEVNHIRVAQIDEDSKELSTTEPYVMTYKLPE